MASSRKRGKGKHRKGQPPKPKPKPVGSQDATNLDAGTPPGIGKPAKTAGQPLGTQRNAHAPIPKPGVNLIGAAIGLGLTASLAVFLFTYISEHFPPIFELVKPVLQTASNPALICGVLEICGFLGLIWLIIGAHGLAVLASIVRTIVSFGRAILRLAPDTKHDDHHIDDKSIVISFAAVSVAVLGVFALLPARGMANVGAAAPSSPEHTGKVDPVVPNKKPAPAPTAHTSS